MTELNEENRFTAEELADRATSVYRLIDDLPFEDACTVINAVITAKIAGAADGPELKEIPILGRGSLRCV